MVNSVLCSCSFLRKLYDSSEECPRSYDKLHFNPRYLLPSLLTLILCLYLTSKTLSCGDKKMADNYALQVDMLTFR